MLKSMGSQRVGHDLATEQQQQQVLMKRQTMGGSHTQAFLGNTRRVSGEEPPSKRPSRYSGKGHPLEGGWAREPQDGAEVGGRGHAYISRQCCLEDGWGGGAPKGTVKRDLS